MFDTTNGAFVTLPRPTGIVTIDARDVNDDGFVVGQYLRPGSGPGTGYRGYVYSLQTGAWTELEPLPGGAWAAANAINSKGQVSGFRSIGPGVNPQTGFIWTPGAGYTDIGVLSGPSSHCRSLNDLGDSCGWTGSAIFPQAFIRIGDRITMISVPGVPYVAAIGINNAREVALVGDGVHRYHDGVVTSMPPLGNGFDLPGGSTISAGGTIAGACTNGATNDQKGCLWIRDTVVDLSALLADPAIAALRVATDLTDEGTVLIGAITPGGLPVAAVIVPKYAQPGDANCDDLVNGADLLALVAQWGRCTGCSSDFNTDQVVDVNDLLILVGHWTG